VAAREGRVRCGSTCGPVGLRESGARERGGEGTGRNRPNRGGENGFLFFFFFLTPFLFFKYIYTFIHS
jgi:hypothetical protein